MFEWFAYVGGIVILCPFQCRQGERSGATQRAYFRAPLPFYCSFAPTALFKALASDSQLNGPLVYLIDLIKYPAAAHDAIKKID